jgi:hypothetical protein
MALSKLEKTLGASVIALTTLFVQPAFAQNEIKPIPNGTCMPTAQMMDALKAQGQRSIIVGNRAAAFDNVNDRFVNERRINVITTNDNGSLGYNIEGNAEIGKPSTEMCVGTSMTNIRLHDPWSRVAPANLSPVVLNSAKYISENRGIMMTANYSKVTIIMDVDRNYDGGLTAISTNGQAIDLGTWGGISYTEHGKKMIQSQQLAPLEAKVP